MAATLLEQMVDPISRVFTPEAARQILQVQADQETQQRIDELADKCNAGTLSADERTEYESFIAWFNLLTLLQAKARTFLKNGSGQ